MSGEIIEIKAALEERQFKAKEDRLKKLREAFRAARLGAKRDEKLTSSPSNSTKRKKKNPKNKR